MTDDAATVGDERITDGERSADALESMRYERASTHRDVGRLTVHGVLDRCRALPSGGHTVHVLGLGLIGLVLVALGVAVVVIRSTTRADEGGVAPTIPVAAAVSTTAPIAPAVVVHAAGAVRSPGVYRMPVGSRVVDLLERAGGPTADFDLERANLASPLLDGARVWLPRVGEAPPAVAATAGGDAGGAAAPIDLNHATAEQLDALPGIGKTIAAAIVADRTKRGAFRSLDDLLRVKGMNRSKLDALRDLAVVG